MSRDENIEVFEDTKRMCKQNIKIKESLSKSIKGQKIVLETDEIKGMELKRFDDAAKIKVSKKRTFEAAAGYASEKVAVLNFASATNPGGGVVRGAGAQEECLCRCSGLYFCLDRNEVWDEFYTPHREAHYPAYNDDIVYTPDVLVFKYDTSSPSIMPEREWYNVNVITCASPNVRALTDKIRSGEIKDRKIITPGRLQEMHEKRLRRILDVAVENGNTTIILGAFGCGAFGNSPETVARAAVNVLPDYLYAFKNIEYAVYCPPRDDMNYRVFDRVLKAVK